ncbi:hypothetical protein [Rhodococcus qingshengii]|uniref:hypothetical protein n=1 Tax=Rhodococcus qingshengii TaxID=334542 RepID=UPI000E27FCE9|nr:hypothetical protein [Rhodococcus qingshengii]
MTAASTIHPDRHPQAGTAVTIDVPGIGAGEYWIEDWWDRAAGMSWMVADGNPAALKYAIRVGFSNLPVDNEVVYGHLGSFGHLIHTSELP